MNARGFIYALLLLACGVVAGIVLTGQIRHSDYEVGAQTVTAAAPQTAAITTPAPVSAGLPDFTRVAERTVPAVANISSTQVVRRQNSPYANDPFYRFFYGDQDEIFGRRGVESSLGSGVIISGDGYILTNNHVVTGERQRVSLRDIDISVALSDKRELPAQVVGVDAETDLALLKINARNLPTIAWGDSSRLKVAEWVLAIGNPYQLSQTVTLGIVSATGRNNIGLARYEDFIQTDAAINPGNSGGALVSARGELVGINTAIFSESGGYQGIGFAVPSNLARRVVGDLMKFGEVRRGSVGYLRVDKLTDQLAEEVRSPTTNGAVVSRMMRDSETYNAGLRPGDVIVEFNKQAVDDPSQFFRMVADAKVGSTAAVRVLRDGRPLEFKLPIVSSSESSARVRR
jgi:Do/DeqQ family serine protease